jgi:hypothetical protein
VDGVQEEGRIYLFGEWKGFMLLFRTVVPFPPLSPGNFLLSLYYPNVEEKGSGKSGDIVRNYRTYVELRVMPSFTCTSNNPSNLSGTW